jgi:hypothetical protein
MRSSNSVEMMFPDLGMDFVIAGCRQQAGHPPVGLDVIRTSGLTGSASSGCCDSVGDRSATANRRHVPPIADGDAALRGQTG